MHLRPRPLFLLSLCLFSKLLSAQTTTEQLIEDVAAQATEGGEFTFTDVLSLLESYRRRPLDLNRATADEINATLLLTPPETDRLLAYRERMNGLISVYELQTVLEPETVRRLLPFVRAGGGEDDVNVSFKHMLLKSDRELFVRGARRLEEAKGYREPDGKYLGSPWRSYVKYRQRYGRQLSFGMVAEKDPGEPFWRKTERRRGFDYYSAHLFARNLSRRVRALAVGDYSVSFGQGLILYTGFGFGKSSLTTSVARAAPVLQPYASVNESSFMRGAGTTLQYGDVEVTVFGSRRRRIGNLSKDSSSISSMSESGLSRTLTELEDRKAVAQTSYGGSVKYRAGRRLRLAFNVLGERLSLPLQRRPAPYNRYYFNGDRLHNLSFDYRYRVANFSFFGELAHAMTAGSAMLHGVNIGLGKRADAALVYRNYGKNYQALSARPFGESSGGRNEAGLYVGMEWRPSLRWRINAYYDRWRHTFRRYRVDGPSTGREYRLRTTYRIKRKLEAYVELRSETKGINGLKAEGAEDAEVVGRTRFQARFHAGYHLSKALEWRSRLDVGYSEDDVDGKQRGTMLYQDLHYRPLGPFAFSLRVAAYDTDSYDVRFYQYENGLTYNAYVLPYYYQGGRSYLLMRYKGIRDLTLEARIAQSRYFDGRTFGRGNDATDKTYRTEIAGQVIWRW